MEEVCDVVTIPYWVFIGVLVLESFRDDLLNLISESIKKAIQSRQGAVNETTRLLAQTQSSIQTKTQQSQKDGEKVVPHLNMFDPDIEIFFDNKLVSTLVQYISFILDLAFFIFIIANVKSFPDSWTTYECIGLSIFNSRVFVGSFKGMIAFFFGIYHLVHWMWDEDYSEDIYTDTSFRLQMLLKNNFLSFLLILPWFLTHVIPALMLYIWIAITEILAASLLWGWLYGVNLFFESVYFARKSIQFSLIMLFVFLIHSAYYFGLFFYIGTQESYISIVRDQWELQTTSNEWIEKEHFSSFQSIALLIRALI